ncbi:MAG: divergent polysaccharide deacetylase family protein [Candidatus Omnitrophica bacterium]|nr:divergent polysaccharide deacetylase family protein [Candidatus Omnitrophota bacterium]
MAKRKSGSIKKFLEDYPIIPVVVITFVLGSLFGYGVGQMRSGNRLEWRKKVEKPKAFKKEAIASSVPATVVPAVLPTKLPKASLIEEAARVTEELFHPTPMGEQVWKPRIAFVIDDVGHNKHYNDLLFSMERPVTLAILPQVTYSKFFAEEGKKHGFETILHLPLEPENDDDPGPGTISVRMSTGEVRRTLNQNFASVPGVTGLNNHMGSLATRDRGLMYLILKELKRRNLFFLDSMTHPNSVAHQVAFGVGIPAFQRDVFLDNVDEVEYIKEQIEQAARVAKQVGRAVAIGHYRENTLSAIKEAIPRLEAEGFEISSLEDLM